MDLTAQGTPPNPGEGWRCNISGNMNANHLPAGCRGEATSGGSESGSEGS